MTQGPPDDETQPYPGVGGYQHYSAPSYPPAPPPGHPSGHYAMMYGAPGTTPYGVDPVTGVPWSEKSRVTAGLLQLLLPFVGVCGVGRLYAGQTAIGLLQLLGFFFGWILVFVLIGLLVVPAIWLWTVIDGIVLLASGGRDGLGRPLRN
jgi:TM2 domain-containing membrane protein YozV